MWAISPEGKKLWDAPAELPVEDGPVVLADDTVCFASRLWLFNYVGSVKKWSVYMGGYGSASPAISPTGVIYGEQEPQFVALTNTVPMASSIWPRFRGNARNTGNVRDLLTAAKH
jgi:hypothetical protein